MTAVLYTFDREFMRKTFEAVDRHATAESAYLPLRPEVRGCSDALREVDYTTSLVANLATAAKLDACNLANNHVLDFGPDAVDDTLRALDGAGIARTGAGRDLDEALEPAVTSAGGFAVAVVGFTDNTPEYAAGQDSPGTARIEMDTENDESRSAVREALSRARWADPDFLVASLHWGPNMVTEPPETFRRFARFLADEGVDLVHGHSAHVFQGIEVVDGVPVLYDAGDFVDDYAVDSDLRNDRSFLFEARLDAGDASPTALRLLPVEIEDCAVHRADPSEVSWWHDRMRERSARFGTRFERDGDELVLPLARSA